MEYRTACLLGSLLLMARQAFEFFRLLPDVRGETRLLLMVVMWEGLFHGTLLLAALTMRRRALMFWLYFAHPLANYRLYKSLWCLCTSPTEREAPLVHAVLLCAVWHAAFQCLLQIGGRHDPTRAPDDVAPDAPFWERDVHGLFGWRMMADNEKVLAGIGRLLTSLWRRLRLRRT